MKTMTTDIDDVGHEVETFRQVWLREKRALDETVAYVSKHKVNPGDGYWQAERQARLRYEIAKGFRAALLDD